MWVEGELAEDKALLCVKFTTKYCTRIRRDTLANNIQFLLVHCTGKVAIVRDAPSQGHEKWFALQIPSWVCESRFFSSSCYPACQPPLPHTCFCVLAVHFIISLFAFAWKYETLLFSAAASISGARLLSAFYAICQPQVTLIGHRLDACLCVLSLSLYICMCARCPLANGTTLH